MCLFFFLMIVKKVKDYIIMFVYEDFGLDKLLFFFFDEIDKCISRLSEWYLVYGWYVKIYVVDKEN